MRTLTWPESKKAEGLAKIREFLNQNMSCILVDQLLSAEERKTSEHEFVTQDIMKTCHNSDVLNYE